MRTERERLARELRAEGTEIAVEIRAKADKERTIIEKYFGLNGVQCNLEDLGEEFGCTKERIRQVKEKAMKKLRNESFTLLKYL